MRDARSPTPICALNGKSGLCMAVQLRPPYQAINQFYTTMTKTITTINATPIVAEVADPCADLGDALVPIRPICNALGIAFSGQFERIKRDPILNSTVRVIRTVGADGKDRGMCCLPLKYIFGWLFTINSDMVREGAREQLISYQRLCYETLYSFMTGGPLRVISLLKEELSINNLLREAESRKAEAQRDITELKAKAKDAHRRALEFDQPSLFDNVKN